MIFLHFSKLPGKLLLEINGEGYCDIFDKSELTEKQHLQHADLKWYEHPTTNRYKFFLEIWGVRRILKKNEIESQINTIREWAGGKNFTYSWLPMKGH